MTTVLEPEPTPSADTRRWLDHRTVWRWHFYAGLIAIPFVVVLSITGAIYLFRSQIETWIDRPYDHLAITGARASVSQIVHAALAAVPGSTLNAYELPPSEQSACRVLLNTDRGIERVYVHPQTLQILHRVRENDRLMRWIFRIHGELLLGNVGSYVVEIAASWTIVLILTGLWLWWPRDVRGWGGILYPRLTSGSRLMWRDLHAVTGFWISASVLLLLLSGLPWAKFWGDYFREVRQLTHTAPARQDWVNGAAPDAHAAHRGHHMMPTSVDLAPLDRLAAEAANLHLPAPVTIEPPAKPADAWQIKSLTADRPQRVELSVDSATGRILRRSDFSNKLWLDRVVGTGVAWHEGQLFGWLNQLIGLLSAMGLLLLCLSSVVLWWRRRAVGVLGAPKPSKSTHRSIGLSLIVLGLAIFLPLFGASLLAVRLMERLVLRQIRPVAQWLGLSPSAAVLQ